MPGLEFNPTCGCHVNCIGMLVLRGGKYILLEGT